MDANQGLAVSILLPTYNGAEFIDSQIRSLSPNATQFTLEWLDDHSGDNTREVFRAAAAAVGVNVREWHQPQHQGYPAVFFRLMECVDADIYLFCDQDDIWQPGKIDATVTALFPNVKSPALCFSEALMFRDGQPDLLPLFDFFGAKIDLKESRAFLFCPAQGNTIGFTRPLRDIFLSHKDIARVYAPGHDCWMYLVAVASGTCHMLSDVPTTLYRVHENNVGAISFGRSRWRLQQLRRQFASRQAKGFALASATMPPSPRLNALLELAEIIETLDRRQSPAALFRLAHRGALPPSLSWAAQLMAACLFTHADSSRRTLQITNS